MIDPFAMNLAGGLDRYRAYWWATAMRASYLQFSTIPTRLHNLVENPHQEAGLTPGTLAVPRTDAFYYPNLAAGVVVVRGTQGAQQAAAQVLTTVLVSLPGWAGQVVPFHANAAIQIAATIVAWRVGKNLNSWAIIGHSMGGSVAALLRGLVWAAPPPLWVVDMGSPRSGSAAYAAAQTYQRLRLTNTGDPVPLIPPSVTPGLTQANPFLPLQISPVQARHWGTRHHLWRDGSSSMPLELGIDQEGPVYLQQAIARGDWVGDHATGEYCRRLRMGIPVRWPAPGPIAEFPELDQLDVLNREMNDADGTPWLPTQSAVPWPAGPGIFQLPTCDG